MDTADISPKDVMTLRQRTGLGMMDCKKALADANGDMAAAEELLRQRMKGKMDSRTDRPAGEGCIVVAIDGGKAAILEVRAETDFTARNDGFRGMSADLAKMSLEQAAGEVATTDAMSKRLDDVRLTTGENISFARGRRLDGGSFGQYIHHDGKLGVLLQVEGEVPADVLTGICQHVAAHVPTPMAVDEQGLDAAVVAQKRAEAQAEAAASGKPAEIASKIAEGKVRKFFEENTLLGQKFVRDESKQVRDLLPKGSKILAFVRMAVGGA
jgi:elongation factor Ts